MGKNTINIAASDALASAPPHYSEFRRVVRVFFGRKLAVIGLAIIALLILTAIFAPWLAPYPPNQINLQLSLAPPSTAHWLGNDNTGRDTLSRLIYGARTSMVIAIGATALSAIVGETLGLIAAHFGGITFHIIMRLIDALMAIPMLLVALIMASVLGGGARNVILALGVGMIPVHARVMCGQALSVKQNDYVLAARAMGMGDLRTIFSQIFPNAFPTLMVVITVGMGAVILAEAGLSFLGVGVMPPYPAWGSMISDGYKYILTNPLLSFSPGIAIMLAVFGFNMMGDGLRDALDPKLRGVI